MNDDRSSPWPSQWEQKEKKTKAFLIKEEGNRSIRQHSAAIFHIYSTTPHFVPVNVMLRLGLFPKTPGHTSLQRREAIVDAPLPTHAWGTWCFNAPPLVFMRQCELISRCYIGEDHERSANYPCPCHVTYNWEGDITSKIKRIYSPWCRKKGVWYYNWVTHSYNMTEKLGMVLGFNDLVDY